MFKGADDDNAAENHTLRDFAHCTGVSYVGKRDGENDGRRWWPVVDLSLPLCRIDRCSCDDRARCMPFADPQEPGPGGWKIGVNQPAAKSRQCIPVRHRLSRRLAELRTSHLPGGGGRDSSQSGVAARPGTVPLVRAGHGYRHLPRHDRCRRGQAVHGPLAEDPHPVRPSCECDVPDWSGRVLGLLLAVPGRTGLLGARRGSQARKTPVGKRHGVPLLCCS